MDPNKMMSSNDKSKSRDKTGVSQLKARALSDSENPIEIEALHRIDTSISNITNEIIQNQNIKSNHLLELLCRDSNLNIEIDSECNLAFSFNQNKCCDTHNNQTISVDEKSYKNVPNNETNIKTCRYINIDTVRKNLRKIIKNKEYQNQRSVLRFLRFKETDLYLIVSTCDVTDTMRYVDTNLDRVLHQSRVIVFDRKTLNPVLSVSKPVKDCGISYVKNENSYIKSYVFDKYIGFNEDEFNKSIVSIHKNHIGTYIVIFYNIDKWYFMFSNNVYELTMDNHGVLYEHVGHNVHKFDKNLCYHIILVDSRLRRLFTPNCETNHIILVKLTNRYTLEDIDMKLYTNAIMKNEIDSGSDSNSNLNQNDETLFGVFVLDTRIYMSCVDELNVKLEELDAKNIKMRKLLHRGFVVKVNIDEFDELIILYDTSTYNKLLSMVPTGMSLNEVHLKLYQNDQLNHFLQHVTDSYTDIVKRINIAMSTMSREILDIYHMTRKKKNSNLYNLLPQSYRQILYQLHSDYIAQKNNINCEFIDELNIDSANTIPNCNVNLKNLSNDVASVNTKNIEKMTDAMKELDNSNGVLINNEKHDNLDESVDSADSADSEDTDNTDGKVSISVDNVYTKLKELDTHMLIELYRDREILIKNIEDESKKPDMDIKNPIKHCTNTKIQSKLLSSR